MSSSGFQLLAGRIPGERVGGTVRTSSVTGITTTETTVDSATAPLVAGRTYGIWWFSQVQSDVANDDANVRLREDNATGTRMTIKQIRMVVANQNYQIAHYAEYTAAATANKTFVGTVVRAGGTGTLQSPASTTSHAILYVEYISG